MNFNNLDWIPRRMNRFVGGPAGVYRGLQPLECGPMPRGRMPRGGMPMGGMTMGGMPMGGVIPKDLYKKMSEIWTLYKKYYKAQGQPVNITWAQFRTLYTNKKSKLIDYLETLNDFQKNNPTYPTIEEMVELYPCLNAPQPKPSTTPTSTILPSTTPTSTLLPPRPSTKKTSTKKTSTTRGKKYIYLWKRLKNEYVVDAFIDPKLLLNVYSKKAPKNMPIHFLKLWKKQNKEYVEFTMLRPEELFIMFGAGVIDKEQLHAAWEAHKKKKGGKKLTYPKFMSYYKKLQTGNLYIKLWKNGTSGAGFITIKSLYKKLIKEQQNIPPSERQIFDQPQQEYFNNPQQIFGDENVEYEGENERGLAF